MRKLSVNLIRTYKHINEVYYANKRRKKKLQQQLAAQGKHSGKHGTHNNGHDDENYDYKIIPDEELAGRYVSSAGVEEQRSEVARRRV